MNDHDLSRFMIIHDLSIILIIYDHYFMIIWFHGFPGFSIFQNPIKTTIPALALADGQGFRVQNPQPLAGLLDVAVLLQGSLRRRMEKVGKCVGKPASSPWNI